MRTASPASTVPTSGAVRLHTSSSRVDLPQPLGPTTATTSPGVARRSRRSRATTRPSRPSKDLVTPASRTSPCLTTSRGSCTGASSLVTIAPSAGITPQVRRVSAARRALSQPACRQPPCSLRASRVSISSRSDAHASRAGRQAGGVFEGTSAAHTRVVYLRGTQLVSRHRDQVVAELAAAQHGVVERGQLRALGLTDRQITRSVAAGRLHPLYRGVYAVGHPLVSRKGRYMAAVLAAGEDAVLSHRSAADLWGLRPDNRPRTDVASRRRAGDHPGIKVHHSQFLDPPDVTALHGIPVTSAMRPLVDLPPLLNVPGLARALRRADEDDRLDMTPLDRLLAQRPRGATTLRALLGDFADGPRQKSELERLLRKICKANKLPLPHCNVLLHGYEIDFLWPDHKLVAEADSWLYHGNRYAFNRDRKRDATLTTLHYRTVRFTDLQLVHEPRWVAQTLAKLLR